MEYIAVKLHCCMCSPDLALTSVTRSWFDNRVPSLKEALLFGVLHHAEADAIFDTSSSIVELAFDHC